MKFSNSMNNFLINLILSLKLAKISSMNVQKAISLSVLDGFQQMRTQNLSRATKVLT